MRNATLVILLKGNPVAEVLLGYKKIGFGQGKYAGFGGKIEPGEGVAEAALRELTEEAGVCVPQPTALEFRATLEFNFPHKRAWEQRVFVFCTHHWEGTPTESREMRPEWFMVEQLPYHEMWNDAHYWLPRIIAGEKFRANFEFKRDNATVERAIFTSL